LNFKLMNRMWRRLSLQTRILVLLTALILTALAGGLVTIWHTDSIDSLLSNLIEQHMASFQVAEELETALVRQRGFVTYYFLDQNPEWLAKLEEYHLSFLNWLAKARSSAATPEMVELLNQIEQEYQKFILSRQEVIKLYQQSKTESVAALHWEVRDQFNNLYALCNRYKLIHEKRIAEARARSRYQARLVTNTSLTVMPGVAFLGLLLGYILFKQILSPIREMVGESNPAENSVTSLNEVQALSQKVHNLRENVDLAQSQLKRSQVSLVQSEKLAMAGKLAASVAHSIRNPLTSVKMRLYSMRRHLELPPPQQEDLDVISEEIRNIDAIVRNFLEYSRPPKLKMQQVKPSAVVDLAITLLRPRLESFNVGVTVNRKQQLPEIWADQDQLKEVLVNLMVNACEAMVKGGAIIITEAEDFMAGVGRVVKILVQDTGPGVPLSMQDKIFQPFFSSKEEGTGLGLSIAARIIEEHGGSIDLMCRPGKGACFTIILPLRKIRHGNHTDS
jgi:signal transduction histidine kinase